jgi:hypothetical protein
MGTVQLGSMTGASLSLHHESPGEPQQVLR